MLENGEPDSIGNRVPEGKNFGINEDLSNQLAAYLPQRSMVRMRSSLGEAALTVFPRATALLPELQQPDAR
jgi:hypothetical protein